MRSFLEIELLKNIYNNPHNFIGQRNFHLLYCFMNGCLDKELATNKNELTLMPSFRDFIELETGIELSASLHWKGALGFNVEDQRELFKKYFGLVFKYEKLYPVNYSEDFIIDNLVCKKTESKFSIIEGIKAMSERPIMFNIIGISSLRAYIDGAIYRTEVNDISFSKNELDIIEVINYYKRKINPEIKHETWDRVLMKEEMNINELTVPNFSNSLMMDSFIKILEEKSSVKFKSWKELKR